MHYCGAEFSHDIGGKADITQCLKIENNLVTRAFKSKSIFDFFH